MCDQEDIGCVLDAFIKQHKEDMSSGAQYPIDERDLVQLVQDFFGEGNFRFCIVKEAVLKILL